MKHNDLSASLDALRSTSPSSGNSATTPTLIVSLEFLVDLANSIWSLRKIATAPEVLDGSLNAVKINRHVERIWESLELAGLNIQDHTDDLFDSGQSLDVLAFQPTFGVEREVVCETLKPSVYIRSRRIQAGQVIVATPKKSEEEIKHGADHD